MVGAYDITKGNKKRIKSSIFNGLQEFTTTRDYGWRLKKSTKKDYKLWKIAMKRLSLDRFLPNKLEN